MICARANASASDSVIPRATPAHGASVTLIGDLLNVRDNQVMQWTDFEDAVYILAR